MQLPIKFQSMGIPRLPRAGTGRMKLRILGLVRQPGAGVAAEYKVP
jgi:hypothetical protein